MKTLGDSFLRRPATAGELTADAVRVLTLLSVVVATGGWGPVEFAVFALALLGTVVPRALGVPAGLDIATGVTCLVAAWSNVFDLYTTLIGWDKVVHAVLTGVLAALVVVIGQRSGLLAPLAGHRLGHTVLATLVGIGLGALWEIGEWAGHTFVDQSVFVGYVDTIGDLAYDAIGGLVAGLALPILLRRRHDPPVSTESRAWATAVEYDAASRGPNGSV